MPSPNLKTIKEPRNRFQSPNFLTFKEPRNRFQGIDSSRLGIDSFDPWKVYKFGLWTSPYPHPDNVLFTSPFGRVSNVDQRPLLNILRSPGIDSQPG
jgi:hypothetical protein